MSGEARDTDLSQEPVGSGDYVVQQGDCITSIAHRAGHFWQTIWDHPNNEEIRNVRKDPNILLPGDHVTVPPIKVTDLSRPTDQLHKFVRKGEPAKLRLRVMTEEDRDSQGAPAAQSSDDSADRHMPQPRAHQHYTLELNGTLYEGETDDDGMIDIYIPPGSQSGRLTIGPDGMIIPIQLGTLDPLTSHSGIQARLNNLGFNSGPPDGTWTSQTRAALKMFQQQYGLEQTGQADTATVDKLKEVHGS